MLGISGEQPCSNVAGFLEGTSVLSLNSLCSHWKGVWGFTPLTLECSKKKYIYAFEGECYLEDKI